MSEGTVCTNYTKLPSGLVVLVSAQERSKLAVPLIPSDAKCDELPDLIGVMEFECSCTGMSMCKDCIINNVLKEIARLKNLNESLAERIASQSYLLAKWAEKNE